MLKNLFFQLTKKKLIKEQPIKRYNPYVEDSGFRNWYFNHIPNSLETTKEELYVKEQKEINKIKKQREYMSIKSEVSYFLKRNEGKQARVLKDMTDNNMSLYNGERITIDSNDEDFINLLVYKLNSTIKITDLILILAD